MVTEQNLLHSTYKLDIMMSYKFALIFCLITPLLFLGDVAGGPLPGPAIRIILDAGLDSTAVVRSHSVVCTLNPTLTSLEKVTALTLYGSKSFGAAGQFDPLATFDLWTLGARALGGLSGADVNVFGQIGGIGDTGIGGGRDPPVSQLGISWIPQLADSPRQYKCVANGLDRVGRAVTISITTSTASTGMSSSATTTTTSDLGTSDNPQNNSSSTGLAITDSIQRNLSSRMDSIQDAVGYIGEQLENYTSIILRRQELILKGLRFARFAPSLDTFDVSSEFEGRRYFVSKTVAPFDIRTADLRCEVMGGYLLEIENKAEYDFVFSFVKGVGGDNFFTGANDITNEGVWTYWHSGQTVKYPNWHPGQPNNYNGNEDCMEMRISVNASNDWHCTAGAKFVCEVPI
ncbi:hypothetical protein EGW08_006084 [Elysia chlorotica]|uniref:C-type lectin domain-containing protein n=1 Tax=Elysia chlorotica TaxID=188477 RepID=A0A3S1A9J8_ELYCH|nr:hypothetical protein EGW08_006084 [Elysia chlorotica]